ncbi:MAG: hypothetical protein U0414_37775 [Polyangiaceae bacterium]
MHDDDEDPLGAVVDHPLAVTSSMLDELARLRARPKLGGGILRPEEIVMLEPMLDAILDELIAGLATHPAKRWVLERFQPRLIALAYDDTEVREHFSEALWTIMQIVGVESSDGVIAHYLG